MSNIMQNRINTVLTPAEMQELKILVQKITDLLPGAGTLTLTDEERASLTSLDVSNKAFVEDAINEIRHNGNGILPLYVQAEQVQNDLLLFEQMDEVLSLLAGVSLVASDLLRVAASEAVGTSNLVYRLFKAAAESGVQGTQNSYDKLKARYSNNGAGAKSQQEL